MKYRWELTEGSFKVRPIQKARSVGNQLIK